MHDAKSAGCDRPLRIADQIDGSSHREEHAHPTSDTVSVQCPQRFRNAIAHAELAPINLNSIHPPDSVILLQILTLTTVSSLIKGYWAPWES